MGKDNGMCMCGMHLCSKCTPVIVLFGLLFLVAGLGLYMSSWFNGWSIAGAFLVVWGAASKMM